MPIILASWCFCGGVLVPGMSEIIENPVFEIGWEEDGQRLELRVQIVPVEVAEDY